jgi:hypothetical protein
MMRLILGLAMSVLAFVAANADPLAESHAGKMQCHRPDTVRKTCGSMSSYTMEPGGVITNKAEVLLSPHQVLTMTTVTPVVLKGEAICGQVRAQDLQTADIRLNGAILPDAQAKGLRTQLAQHFGELIGKEICTIYVPAGDKLSTQVTVDGVAKPAYTQIVIWVKPEDDYKVAP